MPVVICAVEIAAVRNAFTEWFNIFILFFVSYLIFIFSGAMVHRAVRFFRRLFQRRIWIMHLFASAIAEIGNLVSGANRLYGFVNVLVADNLDNNGFMAFVPLLCWRQCSVEGNNFFYGIGIGGFIYVSRGEIALCLIVGQAGRAYNSQLWRQAVGRQDAACVRKKMQTRMFAFFFFLSARDHGERAVPSPLSRWWRVCDRSGA